MTDSIARPQRRWHARCVDSDENRRSSSSPPALMHPVQPRTHAHKRDAGVQDGVTAEMYDALVAQRSHDAEDFSANNESRAHQHESDGHT
jgi:hypothetical protein